MRPLDVAAHCELMDNVKRMIRDGKTVPGQVIMGPRTGEVLSMKEARENEMRLKDRRLRRVIRDTWLIQAGREFRLSEAFDRWERAGIDLSRPFTVVVDKRGRRVTVEQERE